MKSTQMKKPLTLLLFMIFLIMSGIVSKAENLNDSIPEKSREFKKGIRFSPSMNFFDYGDLSFGQIASDYKFGAALGMVFDWKMSDFNRFRLEPYLEYQKINNNSINPDIEAITSFSNLIFGLDALPLVLTYGGKYKGTISAGGFAKYILNSSQSTTLNGNSVNNFEVAINKLQYGFSFGAGAYLGKRLVELRYYQSLNDFVNSPVIPNSINQVQLILVY
jgi:hypothetical protein